MRRVLVIGSPGAGKSTFSRRLATITGLDLIHLDRLYWKAGWVETPKDEWREIVREKLKGESWIMDGNYGGTMEMRLGSCDTVVYLDLSRFLCTWRVIKRVFQYGNEARPDIAPGCPERIDLKFVMWTWRYPARSKPHVEERLERVADSITLYKLTSPREAEQFLARLESDGRV
jgi:adenylate kinase family enzyme